jgi:hypothetical protein
MSPAVSRTADVFAAGVVGGADIKAAPVSPSFVKEN